jgi:nucleobase:cation symporter-1, NCS1 family
VAALLCVNTAVYVSPVAGALKGADRSALVGPLVAGIIYAAMAAHQRRAVPAGATPQPAG